MFPRRILEEKLLQLLAEDVGQGDVTTEAIVPRGCSAKAQVIAKDEGIVAGLEEAATLAGALGLKVERNISEGEPVRKGKVLMTLNGDAAAILAAERTMLNLMSRMSGIATATCALTAKIGSAKLKTRVAATRKSAPGLLYFDKKAVAVGGGDPHRVHLDDMVLIKDNHIAIAGSMKKAIEAAKQNASFSKKIEVEVTNAADALKAAELGVDIIMLDNLSPAQIKPLVKQLENTGFRKVLLEASGGITAENLLEYASTGVDLVSLGELTHSVKAIDISLEIVKAA